MTILGKTLLLFFSAFQLYKQTSAGILHSAKLTFCTMGAVTGTEVAENGKLKTRDASCINGKSVSQFMA